MDSSLGGSENLNAGHRQRLYDRFMAAGFSGMSEHEILELLLFAAIPRRDVKPLAKRLLLHFGTLPAVLDAEEGELLKHSGVGMRTVVQLKLYREVVTLYVGQTRLKRETLSSGRSVAEFARVKLGGSRYENFMVIYLNTQNKLISFDVTEGTVNRATVYPRNIARRALELHASAVILAHNHPGGSAQPSSEDIAVTGIIFRALNAVEVRLIDHIVVTPSDYVSLRAMGVLEDGLR